MNCDCLSKTDQALLEHGVKLSPNLKFILFGKKSRESLALPLVRLDEKKPNSKQAKHLFISFCPFCGESTDMKEINPILKELKPGAFVNYANNKYEVAEIKHFPHGLMIGIYDEPEHSDHVDYINPVSVSLWTEE